MDAVIEFDPEKDAVNKKKHGISLAMAEYLNWETLIAYDDTRYPYGESRRVGYGLLAKRLHAVVFTYRGMRIRVISLRKANNRERKKYET